MSTETALLQLTDAYPAQLRAMIGTYQLAGAQYHRLAVGIEDPRGHRFRVATLLRSRPSPSARYTRPRRSRLARRLDRQPGGSPETKTTSVSRIRRAQGIRRRPQPFENHNRREPPAHPSWTRRRL